MVTYVRVLDNYGWLGVCEVHVNSSIVDEGAQVIFLNKKYAPSYNHITQILVYFLST